MACDLELHAIASKRCFGVWQPYVRCFFKGCVRYIFTSLFFKPKLERLSNWERCFLFHFKSSFLSQENQILEFYILKFYDVIKWLSIKQEMNNLGSKQSLLMKFGQFMSYYKRKNLIKKLYQNCGLKTSSRPFFVCKELSATSIGK